MDIDKFYRTPKDLMASQGFVSPVTGEVVTLNLTEKMIYVYMMDRTTFFENEGKRHFESQATIAGAFNMEMKAAAKALKVFVDHGLLTGKKERNYAFSPYLCWYYSGLKPMVLVTPPDKEKKEKKVVDIKHEPVIMATNNEDDDVIAQITGGD